MTTYTATVSKAECPEEVQALNVAIRSIAAKAGVRSLFLPSDQIAIESDDETWTITAVVPEGSA